MPEPCVRCPSGNLHPWQVTLPGRAEPAAGRRVRRDRLGDDCSFREAPDDPSSGVPIETVPIGPCHQRAVVALAYSDIDGRAVRDASGMSAGWPPSPDNEIIEVYDEPRVTTSAAQSTAGGR